MRTKESTHISLPRCKSFLIDSKNEWIWTLKPPVKLYNRRIAQFSIKHLLSVLCIIWAFSVARCGNDEKIGRNEKQTSYFQQRNSILPELRCHWECVACFTLEKKTTKRVNPLSFWMGRVFGIPMVATETFACKFGFSLFASPPHFCYAKISSLWFALYTTHWMCVNCVLPASFHAFLIWILSPRRRKGIIWMIYDHSLSCNFYTIFFSLCSFACAWHTDRFGQIDRMHVRVCARTRFF